MSNKFERSRHLDDQKLSRVLRSLPQRIPPAGLATNLRVAASRERQRFLERGTLPKLFASWYERTSLSAGEMLRSVALPAAGGLFTAVILFGMWVVPTYPVLSKTASDVPTTLTTEAFFRQAVGMHFAGGDAVVDVTVDDQGSVVDYTIVSGADVFKDPAQRHRLENLLLFTRFTPATEFGQPTASKVRILFSQIDQVDVKG